MVLKKLETSLDGVAMLTDDYFVLSKCTRLIDRQTDGRTDRKAIRAPVKLFELGVRTPGGLFLAYGTPGVSIFGVFVR